MFTRKSWSWAISCVWVWQFSLIMPGMRCLVRAGLVVGSLGAAASVLASFDLMLLPGSDGRIYRYDPVNRIQLGSFSSSLSTSYIAADNSGTAFSGSSGGSQFRSYNYSNGELNGFISGVTGVRSLNLLGGFLYLQTSTQVRKYNATTGAFVGTVALNANSTWKTAALSSGYLIAVGTDASNVITMQSINLSTFALSSNVTTSVTTTATTDLGKAAVAINGISGSQRLAFSYLSGGLPSFAQISLGSTGDLVTSSMNTFSISGAGQFNATSVMPAAVAGHSGLFIVGADFSSPTTTMRIDQYDMATGLLFNNSTTITAPGGTFGASGGFWHPANVVAPEPSTMLMSGVGGLAFLLRRRKR